MKITISGTDMIVTEHKSTTTNGASPVDNHVIIVDQNAGNDVFVLLWGSRVQGNSDVAYELMWRGDWQSCLKEYSDIVGDLIADQIAWLAEIATQ